MLILFQKEVGWSRRGFVLVSLLVFEMAKDRNGNNQQAKGLSYCKSTTKIWLHRHKRINKEEDIIHVISYK